MYIIKGTLHTEICQHGVHLPQFENILHLKFSHVKFLCAVGQYTPFWEAWAVSVVLELLCLPFFYNMH